MGTIVRPLRSRGHAAISDRSIWVGERSAADALDGVAAMLALLRRNAPFLLAWFTAWIVCGAVYVKLLKPEFVASTQVLLTPRQIINDGPEDVRHFHQFLIDGEQCETELRVLRSQQLLSRVFKALNLADSPEMRGGPDGLWAYLATTLRHLDRAGTGGGDIEAFYAFANRVRARRIGLSYAIEISYRAQSAAQAARVTNAIAAAYLTHRLGGVIARERRREVYLESRLKSVESQILAADAGMRLGIVPDATLPDADARILGPADVPLRSSYPKRVPIVLLTVNLGAVSGLLIVLFFQSAPRPRRAGRGRWRQLPPAEYARAA